MAQLLVTAEEMREIDRLTIESFGVPGFALMERAALGAFHVLQEYLGAVRGRRLVVVAGRGNNGGDGFVLSAFAKEAGADVHVCLAARTAELRGEARRAWERAAAAGVPFTEGATATQVESSAAGADVIVDALFGTGLNAVVSGEPEAMIAAINASRRPVLAIDIPSGLDANRGVPLGIAVRATVTATFGFAKLGQVIYPGAEYVGELRVVDIGLRPEAVQQVNPRSYLEEHEDFTGLLRPRQANAHKGHFGHVAVIGGSRGRTGAALLAAESCVRAGAGLTTLAGPASLNPIFAGYRAEIMTACLPDRGGTLLFDPDALRELLGGKTVVVAGPGMGTDEDSFEVVKFLLTEVGLPAVYDADALTCIARQPQLLLRSRTTPVLTPHPGEMARLIGGKPSDVQQNRPGIARSFAREFRCVVVLKGARTLVASPDGVLWVNPTGNPGMASGGMGDVLAGVIGALLAQGLDPVTAARLGVYVHGAAADRLAKSFAPFGYLASEVGREAARVLGELVTRPDGQRSP